ncbi:MAG: class I SAM-dependent methyltransferase [Candidatus Nealsonbacteria bacterium]|nr:class I SAM-dependent methyltransferase [Candidatus Nealsonbacteria bacterium]
MKKSYELKMHNLEENYWWFRGRRDMILRLTESMPKDAKILDVGCSGGLLLEELKNRGFLNLFGIDISQDALDVCRTKRIANVKLADAKDTGFEDNYFDIVLASDVLEHVAEQEKTISEWRRILKKGGKLIVFVPAFGFLWSNHDEINLHQKRYSKKQLNELLRGGGFEPEKSSYWNFPLFFPVGLVRILQKLFVEKSQAKDQLWRVNPLFNGILLNLIKAENKLIAANIKMPVGLSVFCLAKK